MAILVHLGFFALVSYIFMFTVLAILAKALAMFRLWELILLTSYLIRGLGQGGCGSGRGPTPEIPPR